MSYQINIPKPVQKQLDTLPPKQRQKILKNLRILVDTPRPHGVKKLKGYDNLYRIRVGNYRIIYKIKDQEMLILVLSCIHRKDAY